MLLQPQQLVDLCRKPAFAADLDAGRALERRHRLHIDGDLALLQQFLTVRNPGLLASPDALATMLTLMKPASKPVYGGLTNVLSKVFTAAGANFFYEFSDSALADDFHDYLADTTRTGQDFYGQFRTIWGKAALTGFQGVLLVDLHAPELQELAWSNTATGSAATGTTQDYGYDSTLFDSFRQLAPEQLVEGVTGIPVGTPAPKFSYVPSPLIHDMSVTGNRIEYLILTAHTPKGDIEYYAWDDRYCHRVQLVEGNPTYQLQLRTTHGLPYVPACPITTRQPDPTRPVRRTSALAESLEVADIYLDDFNKHELGKAYHAFPQKWSYGIDCDYVPFISAAQYQQYGPDATVQACNGVGYCATSWQGQYTCPKCNGKGKYIPVGADKVYIVKPAPAGDTSVVNPGPAGYIVPDLTSLTYLGAELVSNEAKIEKAVLGKQGILDMSTKVESGLAKQVDLGPVTDRLNDQGDDATVALKFVVDAYGRLRYGDAFHASAVALGKRYHVFGYEYYEARYEAAKKAGLDASVLYSMLEDIIYAKFSDDPMELERNLLKLELTPFPHLTATEALALAFLGVEDLLRKVYLNDFIADFERKNGSVLEFGALISHDKKIDNINQAFTTFIDGKRKQTPALLVPGRYVADPAALGGPSQPAPAGSAAALAAPQPLGDRSGSGATAAASGSQPAAGAGNGKA